MKNERQQYVFINGKMLPISKARISPLDYGYLYGFGVFETMRAYEGHVFRLQSHLERIMAGATKIGIHSPDARELAAGIQKSLRKNNHRDAYVRLTLSAGEGAIGLNPTSCSKPTFVVITKKFSGYPRAKYLTGFTAVTVPITTNPHSIANNLKSNSFLDRLLAHAIATRTGVDEAVMMTCDGFVAEGSISNLFIVSQGELYTPKLSGGILPGVTRNIIFELATERGIRITERNIALEEIYSSDEAFLTNSLIEIMPLTNLNKVTISSGVAGTLTQSFNHQYSKLVRLETLACK
jgi:branched-chain amino acid aminotransferase